MARLLTTGRVLLIASVLGSKVAMGMSLVPRNDVILRQGSQRSL